MNTKKIDWMITLVPLAIIGMLSLLFFIVPEESNAILSQVRFFFGDTLGTYYLIVGLGIFLFLFIFAFQNMETSFLAIQMKNQSIHFLPGDL